MSQTSRSVGSSVQGQQRVLGFSGPLPCPWLWCMTRRGRKSRFCSVCVMGIIYFWQCCLFVFDFRPLTSFLLSNWVCACPCGAPAAVVAGAPGPRLRPSCAHLLPAGSTALLLLLCLQHSFPEPSTWYLDLILAILALELICSLMCLLVYTGEHDKEPVNA